MELIEEVTVQVEAAVTDLLKDGHDRDEPLVALPEEDELRIFTHDLLVLGREAVLGDLKEVSLLLDLLGKHLEQWVVDLVVVLEALL